MARRKSQPPKVVEFIKLLFINNLREANKVRFQAYCRLATRISGCQRIGRCQPNWQGKYLESDSFAVQSFHESAAGRAEYWRVRCVRGWSCRTSTTAAAGRWIINCAGRWQAHYYLQGEPSGKKT